MEQGSPEWHQTRVGKITASKMAALMARTKSGPAASRKNMIAQLAIERLTGQEVENFKNDSMRHGNETEPMARMEYEMQTGNTVTQIAFVDHPEIQMVGCSPDGLVGDDGLVEIKCPTAMDRHMKTIMKEDFGSEYRWQRQHQLFVTGRDWVDAVSYDKRYPPHLQLSTKRFFKNAEDHERIAAEIVKANMEIDEIVASLKARGGEIAA